MKAVVRPLTAAVMVAVVMSSCSTAETTTTTAATTSRLDVSTTTTEPAPATASPTPASAQDLGARLVTAVPAGFVLQPDDVGDTGPSDLAKAVRDDEAPGTERALRTEGFLHGYQRLWVGPDDAELIVFVYQFGTAAGADADFERGQPALTDDVPPGTKPFSVDGLPARRSNAIAMASEDLSAAIVMFTTGPFNVQIIGNGPALAEVRARVSDIAKDQYARLNTT